MKNNLKICIINIYFGKLSDWFDIWISTAKYNKDIDFLLITDQSIKIDAPNIKTLKMTFDDFKKKAKEKLRFNIKLNDPYKLCDYKVVWGIILEDMLKDYDYWGECDNDIVFGNLSHYFEKYNLKNYDKFGCRGHLTLYRNTEKVKSRYKLTGGWFGTYKEIFSSNMIWAFDETPGINAIYQKHNFSYMDDFIFADIDVNYQDIRLVEFNCYSPKNYEKQLFYWTNGKLYRVYYDNGKMKQDEFMYIHLQKRKMLKPEFNPFNNQDFIITNGKFIEKNFNINLNVIEQYNLKKDTMRFKKKIGGAYKKDLRFYWLGRRFLNFKFETKKILKKSIIYKLIKKG